MAVRLSVCELIKFKYTVSINLGTNSCNNSTHLEVKLFKRNWLNFQLQMRIAIIRLRILKASSLWSFKNLLLRTNLLSTA